MQKTVLLVLVLISSTILLAQPLVKHSDKIVVPVIDDHNKVLPYATVELLRGNDSVLVKAGITDSLGLVIFEQISNGIYFIRVTRVNYSPQHTPLFQLPLTESSGQIPAIVLIPAPASLQEVSVSAKKPFIQQVPGKTIINVDAAITNAGTTAMEVLEKSPGVTVDKDGNISLRGRSGVLIMIDNKPSYVSGADLVNLLSNMSSSQIDVIELMTNPPAQFDAAGNAGIINIKTKKNRQKGFNGSYQSILRPGQVL